MASASAEHLPLRRRILKIEDEPEIARTWQSKLGERGFEVVLATSADDAATQAVSCECVLLDFMLPWGRGLWDDRTHNDGRTVWSFLTDRLGVRLPPVILFTNFRDAPAVQEFWGGRSYGELLCIEKDPRTEVQWDQRAAWLGEVVSHHAAGRMLPPGVRRELIPFVRSVARWIDADDRSTHGRFFLVLTGASGAGKSHLAKYTIAPVLQRMCSHYNVESRDMFRADDGVILSEMVGATERAIDEAISESRRYFLTQSRADRTIIVWRANELERVFPRRDSAPATELRQHFTGHLLDVLSDVGRGAGATQSFPFILIGTTNHINKVDKALIDRAHAVVSVPLPDHHMYREWLVERFDASSFFETCGRGSKKAIGGILDAISKEAAALHSGWRDLEKLEQLQEESSHIGAPPGLNQYIECLRIRASARGQAPVGSARPPQSAGALDQVEHREHDSSPTLAGGHVEQPRPRVDPDTPVTLSSMTEDERWRELATDLLAAMPFSSLNAASEALGSGGDRLIYWGQRYRDDPFVRRVNFTVGSPEARAVILAMVKLKNTYKGGQPSWTNLARVFLVNPGSDAVTRLQQRLRNLAGEKQSKTERGHASGSTDGDSAQETREGNT